MIFVANSRRSTEPLYICVVPTTDKNLLAGDVTLDLRLWHPVVRYFIYVRFVKIFVLKDTGTELHPQTIRVK